MRIFPRAASSAVLAATLLCAGTAQATTITFDFESPLTAPFTHVDAAPPVGPGNCRDGSCIKVNKTGADVISIASPLTFSITSFWFQLLGKGDDMLVTTDKDSITLLESTYDHNSGFTFDASLVPMFDGITFVSFIMVGQNGNGRVDDLTVTYDEPSPVPLPAAGLLLAGALGGLAAARRRRPA